MILIILLAVSLILASLATMVGLLPPSYTVSASMVYIAEADLEGSRSECLGRSGSYDLANSSRSGEEDWGQLAT